MKLHEENYEDRGLWTPQSGMSEEAMGRDGTARPEISYILKKEGTGNIETSEEEGSKWLTPPLGGINSSLNEIIIY